MKWIYYYFVILLLLSVSCSYKAPLTGQLELPALDKWASTVYLIQPRSLDEVATSYIGQVLDSAKIQADGRFAFEKLPDAADPILLQLAVQKSRERFANRLDNKDLATANYFPFVWKNGDRLQITAVVEQFQRSFSIINPSPENRAMLQLRDIRLEASQKFLDRNDSEDHDDTQLLEREAAMLNYQKPIMDFAQNTEYLLPAMVAIRWVSPQNDYERVPEFLVSQCQKWQNSNPDHPWVMQLCDKTKRERLPVLKGDKIPDASLPMLAGDTTTLYQLMGKRLTVLDLWASWCAPCRRENRDILVPLWEKYHKDGFQIIGYALDASESSWNNAIEKDGAFRWLHASHLRGDDAPLMEVLRIQTIPANFLVNADGRVLAKNLHGEHLVEFVDSFMRE